VAREPVEVPYAFRPAAEEIALESRVLTDRCHPIEFIP
jgi:hypothetical protein